MTKNDSRRGAGRPAKYATDAEAAAAKREQNRLNAANYTSVAMTHDVRAALETFIGHMEETHGFRPTVAQALRHVIFTATKSLKSE